MIRRFRIFNPRKFKQVLRINGYKTIGNQVYPDLHNVPKDYPWKFKPATGPLQEVKARGRIDLRTKVNYPLPCAILVGKDKLSLVYKTHSQVAEYHPKILELLTEENGFSRSYINNF